MTTRSKWLFIFIGNNNSGKTSVQRNLVTLLTHHVYKKLPSNKLYDISHTSFNRKFRAVFVAGRSYQEFSYTSVADYFRNAFDPKSREADVAFMSSHLDILDIEQLIYQAHRRFYNVGGIFFSNSIQQSRSINMKIAEQMKWDEILLVENQVTMSKDKQKRQISSAAETLLQILISRHTSW